MWFDERSIQIPTAHLLSKNQYARPFFKRTITHTHVCDSLTQKADSIQSHRPNIINTRPTDFVLVCTHFSWIANRFANQPHSCLRVWVWVCGVRAMHWSSAHAPNRRIPRHEFRARPVIDVPSGWGPPINHPPSQPHQTNYRRIFIVSV